MKDTADIRCFVDKACTQELGWNKDNHYTLLLAPPEGADGYHGGEHTTRVYLKNVGRRPALHVSLFPVDVDETYTMSFSKEFIGDMMEQEPIAIDITVTVPRWSPYSIKEPKIVIDYYTLPPIYTDYNPYTSKREFWVEYSCSCPKYIPINEEQINRIAAGTLDELFEKIECLLNSMPCLSKCGSDSCTSLLFSPVQVTLDLLEGRE